MLFSWIAIWEEQILNQKLTVKDQQYQKYKWNFHIFILLQHVIVYLYIFSIAYV